MLNHKEQIGHFDRRITFQSKIVGENESNEDEETGWANVSSNPTVWAEKDERRGNEVYRADKLTDYLSVFFTCRYRTDISPKNRLVSDGIPYNIIAITEISRKRFISIECETGGEYVGESTAEPGEGVFDNSFDNTFA